MHLHKFLPRLIHFIHEFLWLAHLWFTNTSSLLFKNRVEQKWRPSCTYFSNYILFPEVEVTCISQRVIWITHHWAIKNKHSLEVPFKPIELFSCRHQSLIISLLKRQITFAKGVVLSQFVGTSNKENPTHPWTVISPNLIQCM